MDSFIEVSEELSSVETELVETVDAKKIRFQKNLVVWKLKLSVRRANWHGGVSEELSSVETIAMRIGELEV